jgi:hypothetical protein
VLSGAALRTLHDSNGIENARWAIVADPCENYGTIIERITASPAAYRDNAWHITAPAPQTMIPDLIEELVRAGCRIREVSPEKNGLKDKIRTHYEKA